MWWVNGVTASWLTRVKIYRWHRHVNLHKCTTLPMHGWACQYPRPPTFHCWSAASVCTLIVWPACASNLIGLLGCFTRPVMSGTRTAHQCDVPRRKQTPTDGFNIRVNSQISHTSTPDGPNEIKIQTSTLSTPLTLWFTEATVCLNYRSGRHEEETVDKPPITEGHAYLSAHVRTHFCCEVTQLAHSQHWQILLIPMVCGSKCVG